MVLLQEVYAPQFYSSQEDFWLQLSLEEAVGSWQLQAESWLGVVH
jgi:hypothetical protein